MDLDLIVEADPELDAILANVSDDARSVIEQAIDSIRNLGRSRRTHVFELGRALQKIRETLAETSDSLTAAFDSLIGVNHTDYYRALRTYERFRDYAELLPLIHIRVQRYFVDSRFNQQALDDVVALAADGQEVSQQVFEAQVLPHYDTRPKKELLDAVPQEDEDDEDDAAEDRESADEATSDETSSDNAAAAGEPSLTVRQPIDVTGLRDSLVRAATSSIGSVLRDIDDFCRTHPQYKRNWYAKINDASEALLQGLRDLQELDIHA